MVGLHTSGAGFRIGFVAPARTMTTMSVQRPSSPRRRPPKGDPLAERIHSPQRECERAQGGRHEAPRRARSSSRQHRRHASSSPTSVWPRHRVPHTTGRSEARFHESTYRRGPGCAERNRMPVTWIPSTSESGCSYVSSTCLPAPLCTRHTDNCMTPQ